MENKINIREACGYLKKWCISVYYVDEKHEELVKNALSLAFT